MFAGSEHYHSSVYAARQPKRGKRWPWTLHQILRDGKIAGSHKMMDRHVNQDSA